MTSLNGRGRGLVGAVLALSLAACATAAPLDDATFIEARLATSEDLARQAEAQALQARTTFGGASFADGHGGVAASFGADEYDLYQAYVRERQGLKSPAATTKWPWPTVRLAFQSRQALFEPKRSGAHVIFTLCEASGDEARIYGFGTQKLLWQGRFTTAERAQDIEAALEADARPQEYEVFFNYVYWQPIGEERSRVTLVPLPDDLCIATLRSNYPFAPSIGRPLRVSRHTINAIIDPLPREISPVVDRSN